MSGNKKPQPSFAELWDPQSAETREKIEKNTRLNRLSVSIPFIAAAATRSMSKGQLLAMTGFSALGVAKQTGAKQVALKRTRDMVKEQTVVAPQYLQDMAEKLFDKAGIKEKPDVRIVFPKKLQGLEKMYEKEINAEANNQLAIIPKGTVKGVDNHTILIGRNVPTYLTKAEMAAALAHETSHALIRTEAYEPVNEAINGGGTALTLGAAMMIAASLRVKETTPLANAILLPIVLGEVGRIVTHAKMKQADEERADRNSIGLFPHKTALVSGLEKLEKHTLSDAEIKRDPKKPSALTKLFMKINTHKDTNERIKDVEKYYEEACSFYAEHGFDLTKECNTITGSKPDEMCQKAIPVTKPGDNKPN